MEESQRNPAWKTPQLLDMNIHLLSSALLVISAAGFHIPDLNLKSDISVNSSSTNTGLIHSSIRQNWSQSLNIGSVSIAATLVILFVSLVMYLRTSERINDLVKNVQVIREEIRNLSKRNGRKPKQSSPNDTQL